MSLSAIQDSLVKTNLVQQTQTRTDDVVRSQEISQAARQHEQSRQGDQVVLMTHQPEHEGIRPDQEREKEEQRKRRKKQDEDKEAEEKKLSEASGGSDTEVRRRDAMRRINIVV